MMINIYSPLSSDKVKNSWSSVIHGNSFVNIKYQTAITIAPGRNQPFDPLQISSKNGPKHNSNVQHGIFTMK